MPAINIALPAPLRDLIAAQAEADHTTQDRMADQLLSAHLDQAAAAQARGESLAARYLTHPRLGARGDRATLNIARATNDRAVALATALTEATGQRVPKTRLIRAVLWAACDPVPPSARQPLPDPAPRATVTVHLAMGLNTRLGVAALQRGVTREALAAMLLDQAFAALAAQPARARDVAAQPRESRTRSTTTIQVPRQHDGAIQQLADHHFAGVKAQALHALLAYGLAQLEPPAPDDTAGPVRPVYIDPALFARVAHPALALRAEVGRTVTIREVAERALWKEVEREEARLSASGKEPQ